MPEPVLSHDPGPAEVTGPSHGLVYCAVEVPGRNALLFGGYTGKICHMDLGNGDIRELTSLPDGGAVIGLTLAPDLSAVGVCSPRPGRNGR